MIGFIGQKTALDTSWALTSFLVTLFLVAFISLSAPPPPLLGIALPSLLGHLGPFRHTFSAGAAA